MGVQGHVGKVNWITAISALIGYAENRDVKKM